MAEIYCIILRLVTQKGMGRQTQSLKRLVFEQETLHFTLCEVQRCVPLNIRKERQGWGRAWGRDAEWQAEKQFPVPLSTEIILPLLSVRNVSPQTDLVMINKDWGEEVLAWGKFFLWSRSSAKPWWWCKIAVTEMFSPHNLFRQGWLKVFIAVKLLFIIFRSVNPEVHPSRRVGVTFSSASN